MSAQSAIFNPTNTTSAATGDGFSVPRLTTTGRLAITFGTSDAGMMVYDTTLNNLFIWNGSAWESVPASGDAGANGSVQYNDNGVVSGAVNFVWDKTNNRVGIGTASPTLPFVVSNAGAQGFEINPIGSIVSGGIDILSYNRSTSLYKGIGFAAESYLFRVGTVFATDAMTLNSTGLLVGASASGSGEKFNANGTIVSSGQSIGSFAYNLGGFDYSASTKNLRIYAGTSNATGSSVSFIVGTSTTFTQAMTLDASGQLGIGVTPSYLLHTAVASGANRNIARFQVTGASNGLTITWDHATTKMIVNFSNLPTSSAGLASGDLWIDTAAGNTLKVA